MFVAIFTAFESVNIFLNFQKVVLICGNYREIPLQLILVVAPSKRPSNGVKYAKKLKIAISPKQ